MKDKKNNLIVFLFILLSSIFVSIPLLKFNIQYDDGIQHVVRLIETAKELKLGNFFPVIMQNLCNGFGYSWNLFYSPLTAYLPLIFRIFGFSFENCLRLFMFFLSIASGYSMYFLLKKILKNKDIKENTKTFISILGACFYIFAPYRINDMYIRVAVAELASFVFLPIIFNGLYTIINLKQKSLILAFGTAGLILSHTLITFYTAIFCFIYLIVNIKEIKKVEVINLLKNLILAFALTSFYLIPLIESRFTTNYEVFNQSHMVREELLIDGKVSLKELLFIEKGSMAYFIGLPIIVGLILSIYILRKNKILDKKNYYFFLISGLISLILTLEFVPFEKFPSFMTMMQFSFRLLEFSSFFFSIIASINIGLTFKKFSLAHTIIIVLIMADLIIPIIGSINFNDEYIKEEDLLNGIPVTERTGRVHAGCASFEYLPSKAFENRNYIAIREDVPIVLSGAIDILDYKKDKLNLSFKASGEGDIELPYIYYIGYTAKIDGEDIKITESENGFCKIHISNNEYKEIKVSYSGSLSMKITIMVSILSLILSFIYLIKEKIKKSRN